MIISLPYTWGDMFTYFLAMRKYPAMIIPLQEEKINSTDSKASC